MTKYPLLLEALRTDALVKKLLARALILRDRMRAYRSSHSRPAVSPTSVAPEWLERGLGQPEAQRETVTGQCGVTGYCLCGDATKDEIQAFRTLSPDMMIHELNTMIRRYEALLACAENCGATEVIIGARNRVVIPTGDVLRSFYRAYFRSPSTEAGETR